MRILWTSNAPWVPSGYGTQTEIFVPRIQKLGHDVGVFAFYGLRGGVIDWNGIPVFPGFDDMWGNDAVGFHARTFEADLIITLIDAWVLKNGYANCGVPWAAWAPIDHDPIPMEVLQRLRTCLFPIAYSKFGFELMKDAALNPMYVPHGIPSDRYYPIGDRKSLREEKFRDANINDDTFIVTVVAANKGYPPRKSFYQILEAWSKFVQKYPNSFMYMHTKKNGPGTGLDLVRVAELYGISPDNLGFPGTFVYNAGISSEEMNKIYNASDALLNISSGEGFGLTPVEAQFAGLPAITGDNTAQSELNMLGLCVECHPMPTQQGSFQFVPSVEDTIVKLEFMRDNMGNDELREKAHREIVKEYDADHVTEKYWAPVLDAIESVL